MKETLNVGLVGCGDICDIYFQNSAKFNILNITACASRQMDKAVKKAAEYNIPKAVTIDELINDPDIDIILNLTVPEVHAKISLAALEAGKHVYTEKPLAASLEDGLNIITLAKSKGLRVASAPDTFLGGRLQTARKVLDDGLIGDVIGASAFVVCPGHEWFHPSPDFFYQPGGGPLMDVGPYYITALVSLLGPVARVSGMANQTYDEREIHTEPRRGQKIKVNVPTHITANLQFSSGVIGTLITSFDVWDSQLPRIEIYGSKGTLCVPDIDPLAGPNLFGGPLLLKTRATSRWRGFPRPVGFDQWEEVQVNHNYNENSRGLGLVDLAYAIRDERPERASSEMAYHTLEIMLGIIESARDSEFYTVKSTMTRPASLPINFPDSESN